MRGLFPFAGASQQLQSDGKRILVAGLAINDARAGPEITGQRPQIQPLIHSPRIAGKDTGAMGAYVLGEALLGRMADIQTAEVHSY